MLAPQGPHAYLYRVVTGGWQAVFWEEGSEEGEHQDSSPLMLGAWKWMAPDSVSTKGWVES